jgi:hypothetical protein
MQCQLMYDLFFLSDAVSIISFLLTLKNFIQKRSSIFLFKTIVEMTYISLSNSTPQKLEETP